MNRGILILILASSGVQAAEEMQAETFNAAKTRMVAVGTCYKDGVTPPSVSNPPRAIIEREKQFSSYEKAIEFGDSNYARNEALLYTKYCNSNRQETRNGIRATCRGSSLGSSGVLGDNHKVGFFRIYEIDCKMVIPCVFNEDVSMPLAQIRDYIRKRERECVNRYFEVRSETGSKKAGPTQTQKSQTDGPAKKPE